MRRSSKLSEQYIIPCESLEHLIETNFMCCEALNAFETYMLLDETSFKIIKIMYKYNFMHRV